MTNTPSTPSSFVDVLESYLSGLEENGTALVELDAPFPLQTVTKENSVRPRQQPAKVPPVEPAAKKTVLPPPPKQEPVAVPAEEKLVWATLIRLSKCEDTKPSKETAVVLVTGLEETTGENGILLTQILKSAGYEFLGPPLQLTHAEDLAGAGERIVVMGNPALQKISSAGMDLKIVRGMWQTTPHGKMISTFAPSILQDNPAGKKAVWQDIKTLLKDLDLEIPDWTKQKMSKKR